MSRHGSDSSATSQIGRDQDRAPIETALQLVVDPMGRSGKMGAMIEMTAAVRGLIVANAIFFVFAFFVPGLQGFMFESFALFFPKAEHFKIWQFVTHMFMHGSLMHIFFNMFALFNFGTILEKMWGCRRFLIFYFISGIGAAAIYVTINYVQFDMVYDQLVAIGLSTAEIQSILDTGRYSAEVTSRSGITEERLSEFHRIYNSPMVGASGAIYGVLVAFGISYPNAKLSLIFLPIPIAAKFFIPALLLLDLFSGVTGFSLFGGGIAHFAHIGGALIGFLLMWYWRKKGYKGDTGPVYE